jgi:plasmid stabilization system protein ParE
MKIQIHELAVREFDEAIEWYELQSEGLGERFKEATLRQIEKITRNPRWFLIEADDIYKAYVPKFPYKILYTVDERHIVIWAISHMHRKPWYWQARKD